ncbi:carboxyltransferase domain-containing protein [Gordonia sp. (in: high G+C Gram-positive bacteria)]|uniref:5-oxoprolinase subunit B family protein n=1 Tax=Gordonia sp. (in: high G+C Gram-positive bacteria) TaxID=84139 RepID=UPI0016AC5BCD|nr:carboxyltransferase domain-containing protein [Gordonia sp. (in: high G+C Gram-positive bacteria)]NLG46011.1 allophanate hydrolase subunit 1 [Gordonia sp. (in: high G+C Gram-positive bacteria)]
MRELPAGSDAVLLDFSTEESPEGAAEDCARALRAALESGRLPPCDIVLSARTVLIETPPGAGLDQLAVRRIARTVPRRERSTATAQFSNLQATSQAPHLVIPTVYDGADLTEAADLLGVSTDRLVEAHGAILWRVQFMGFAPGFGYLVPDPASAPDDAALFRAITRRSQSRPSVPAGSVAVAAGYSAVYPRSSPGGWFLLGRTALTMWNSRATPPSTLTAGTTVRFDAMPEGTVSDPSAPTTSENTK